MTEKQQVYVSFKSGSYRVYKSYNEINIKDENGFYHISCFANGGVRNLYLNKTDVIFIDIGPVFDSE